MVLIGIVVVLVVSVLVPIVLVMVVASAAGLLKTVPVANMKIKTKVNTDFPVISISLI